MNRILRTRQPRDWWNTVALGVVIMVAFLLIWLLAHSSGSTGATETNPSASTTSYASATPASASAAGTTEESVPTALSNAGEYGENVYDYAKANDWKNAHFKLAALRNVGKKVRADVKNQSTSVDRLDGDVTALDRAVTARDKQSAMREANQVTLDVANMTTAYKLSVPVEVTKLDYYGREFEVWAQAQDANKLLATAREIRGTWDSLRPTIEAHSIAEARKFDALVAQVESAKTPADYAHVATLVLNEVDNLEKLFN
jgi:hypothetical protein